MRFKRDKRKVQAGVYITRERPRNHLQTGRQEISKNFTYSNLHLITSLYANRLEYFSVSTKFSKEKMLLHDFI